MLIIFLIVIGLAVWVFMMLRQRRAMNAFMNERGDLFELVAGIDLQLARFRGVTENTLDRINRLRSECEELNNPSLKNGWIPVCQHCRKAYGEAIRINKWIPVLTNIQVTTAGEVAFLQKHLWGHISRIEAAAQKHGNQRALEELQKARKMLAEASRVKLKWGEDALLWQFALLLGSQELCGQAEVILEVLNAR